MQTLDVPRSPPGRRDPRTSGADAGALMQSPISTPAAGHAASLLRSAAGGSAGAVHALASPIQQPRSAVRGGSTTRKAGQADGFGVGGSSEHPRGRGDEAADSRPAATPAQPLFTPAASRVGGRAGSASAAASRTHASGGRTAHRGVVATPAAHRGVLSPNSGAAPPFRTPAPPQYQGSQASHGYAHQYGSSVGHHSAGHSSLAPRGAGEGDGRFIFVPQAAAVTATPGSGPASWHAVAAATVTPMHHRHREAHSGGAESGQGRGQPSRVAPVHPTPGHVNTPALSGDFRAAGRHAADERAGAPRHATPGHMATPVAHQLLGGGRGGGARVSGDSGVSAQIAAANAASVAAAGTTTDAADPTSRSAFAYGAQFGVHLKSGDDTLDQEYSHFEEGFGEDGDLLSRSFDYSEDAYSAVTDSGTSGLLDVSARSEFSESGSGAASGSQLWFAPPHQQEPVAYPGGDSHKGSGSSGLAHSMGAASALSASLRSSVGSASGPAESALGASTGSAAHSGDAASASAAANRGTWSWDGGGVPVAEHRFGRMQPHGREYGHGSVQRGAREARADSNAQTPGTLAGATAEAAAASVLDTPGPSRPLNAPNTDEDMMELKGNAIAAAFMRSYEATGDGVGNMRSSGRESPPTARSFEQTKGLSASTDGLLDARFREAGHPVVGSHHASSPIMVRHGLRAPGAVVRGDYAASMRHSVPQDAHSRGARRGTSHPVGSPITSHFSAAAAELDHHSRGRAGSSASSTSSFGESGSGGLNPGAASFVPGGGDTGDEGGSSGSADAGAGSVAGAATAHSWSRERPQGAPVAYGQPGGAAHVMGHGRDTAPAMGRAGYTDPFPAESVMKPPKHAFRHPGAASSLMHPAAQERARQHARTVMTGAEERARKRKSLSPVSKRKAELSESTRVRQLYKEFCKELRAKEREGFEAAREHCIASFSKLPQAIHWRVFLDLADHAKRCNRKKQARRLFQMVTFRQPFASQGWLEWAKMEEECGELERCGQILARGLEFCEHHEGLLIKAIKHYERVQDLSVARGLLSRLIEIPLDRSWRTMLEGALLESRAGNSRVARQVFSFLMLNVPWYGPIYHEAFRFEARHEREDRALRIIKRGLKEIPRYGPLWFGALRLRETMETRAFLAQVPACASRPTRVTRSWGDFLERTRKTAMEATSRISKELVWKVHFEAALIDERAAETYLTAARQDAAVIASTDAATLLKCDVAALGAEVDSVDGGSDAAADDGASLHRRSRRRRVELQRQAAVAAQKAANNCLKRCRSTFVQSVLHCPPNLRWKVWLAGARVELTSAHNVRVARALLNRALEEVPAKSRAQVLLERARADEYEGNLSSARETLRTACEETRHDWKVFLESVLLERRAGQREAAIETALAALKVHSGTGRLWAVLVQLRQADGDDAQLAVFREALMQVPKSGEVWCEGARVVLHPRSRHFDLDAARQYLSFAVQFTPQYGDSFIESVRMHLLQNAIKFANDWIAEFSGGHDAGGAVDEARERLRTQLEEVDLGAVERACVNADPNYGSMWFHCKARPFDTASKVLRRATKLWIDQMCAAFNPLAARADDAASSESKGEEASVDSTAVARDGQSAFRELAPFGMDDRLAGAPRSVRRKLLYGSDQIMP